MPFEDSADVDRRLWSADDGFLARASVRREHSASGDLVRRLSAARVDGALRYEGEVTSDLEPGIAVSTCGRQPAIALIETAATRLVEFRHQIAGSAADRDVLRAYGRARQSVRGTVVDPRSGPAVRVR